MMIKTYSLEQMREAERRTTEEYGVPMARLMETAGKALASKAREMMDEVPVAGASGTAGVSYRKQEADFLVNCIRLTSEYPMSLSVY